MTIPKTNPQETVAFALTLIQHLPEALLHYVDTLDALKQRLQELEGRTCTGHAHWRDKNASGKTAKLYVLHGTDQACPVHGKPTRGERTRSYIGNKPDKISDALAAIERETERKALRKDLYRLQGSVAHVTYQLKSLYRYLDHYPPIPGDDAPAIPTDQFPMTPD